MLILNFLEVVVEEEYVEVTDEDEFDVVYEGLDEDAMDREAVNAEDSGDTNYDTWDDSLTAIVD